MNIGPILEEKYKAQKKLEEMAGGDPEKYSSITHELTRNLGEKYKIPLKYGKPSVMNKNTA